MVKQRSISCHCRILCLRHSLGARLSSRVAAGAAVAILMLSAGCAGLPQSDSSDRLPPQQEPPDAPRVPDAVTLHLPEIPAAAEEPAAPEEPDAPDTSGAPEKPDTPDTPDAPQTEGPAQIAQFDPTADLLPRRPATRPARDHQELSLPDVPVAALPAGPAGPRSASATAPAPSTPESAEAPVAGPAGAAVGRRPAERRVAEPRVPDPHVTVPRVPHPRPADAPNEPDAAQSAEPAASGDQRAARPSPDLSVDPSAEPVIDHRVAAAVREEVTVRLDGTGWVFLGGRNDASGAMDEVSYRRRRSVAPSPRHWRGRRGRCPAG